MKQITTVLLILLHLATLKSQELSPNDQQHIRTLIQHVKANNKSQICDLVAYPLSREYPIPAIRNKKEHLTRFDEVFDTKLMKTIAQSDLKTDWWQWVGVASCCYQAMCGFFKSGDNSYICEITILGPQPNTSYELIVTKNGTELMRPKAKLYR